MTNVQRAVDFISDGMIVGLGTGHAAGRFLQALAERIHDGLRVKGVPTSKDCEELAQRLGVPLTPLEAGMTIDVAVDGADEVDPKLNLIKGYGRALVREKIVATAARQFVVLIGPEGVEEKLVATLGQRGKLPVEVVPFGLGFVQTQLAKLGLESEPLRDNGQLLVTDNGNAILECQVSPIRDPAFLESSLRVIPGVVGTGLFLAMADVVLAQQNEDLLVLTNGQSGK